MKEKQKMTASNLRWSAFQNLASSRFQRLATGGEWANAQSAETRRNLIWFWLDGFFASGSDNIVAAYLTVYLLALGATQAQIGLMSSLSSLTAALVLLPGAWLVERLGRRRGMVLVSSGWARLALMLLALMPFLFTGQALVLAAIGLSITRDATNNLCYPAWVSMTGDIVPLEGRGHFFASRNFIMSITGIAATFLVGLLITSFPGNGGYQLAFGLAFFVGTFSIFSFSHLSDRSSATPALTAPDPAEAEPPAAAPVNGKRTLRQQLAEMLANPEFLQFAAVTALWNVALNFAGPFFNVYLVKNLGANAAMVGLTTIASSVAGMLTQLKLGELDDRWGARKMVVISGLLIPAVPLAWAFIDSAWYVIPINLVSGMLWGAYGMGSFNYLLLITPRTRLARFSAVFQVVVTLSLAIGAALGSLAINSIGFAGVFIGSAAGRLAAAALFAILSNRGKRPVRKQASLQ